jgi:aspartate 1-decarboxylase
MQRQMLKSEIHRAAITDRDVGAFDEMDLERYSSVVVHVDDENEVVALDSDPAVLLGGVSPDQEALL